MKLGHLRNMPTIEEMAKAFASCARAQCIFEHELEGTQEDVQFEVDCLARCDHKPTDQLILLLTLHLPTGLSDSGHEATRRIKAHVAYDEAILAGVAFDNIDELPD